MDIFYDLLEKSARKDLPKNSGSPGSKFCFRCDIMARFGPVTNDDSWELAAEDQREEPVNAKRRIKALPTRSRAGYEAAAGDKPRFERMFEALVALGIRSSAEVGSPK